MARQSVPWMRGQIISSGQRRLEWALGLLSRNAAAGVATRDLITRHPGLLSADLLAVIKRLAEPYPYPLVPRWLAGLTELRDSFIVDSSAFAAGRGPIEDLALRSRRELTVELAVSAAAQPAIYWDLSDVYVGAVAHRLSSSLGERSLEDLVRAARLLITSVAALESAVGRDEAWAATAEVTACTMSALKCYAELATEHHAVYGDRRLLMDVNRRLEDLLGRLDDVGPAGAERKAALSYLRAQMLVFTFTDAQAGLDSSAIGVSCRRLGLGSVAKSLIRPVPWRPVPPESDSSLAGLPDAGPDDEVSLPDAIAFAIANASSAKSLSDAHGLRLHYLLRGTFKASSLCAMPR